jgi:hypothetical protein
VRPGANTRLYDLDLRHQVGVSRLVSSMSADFRSLVGTLQSEVESLVRDTDLTVILSKSRIKRMVEPLRAQATKMGSDLASQLLARADDVVDYELEFQETAARSVAETSVAHPSVGDLLASLRSEQVCGRLVSAWGADVGDAAYRHVYQRLTTALGNGDVDRDALAASVTGTRALKYRDGPLSRTLTNVEGLTRTVVTRATVLAKTALFELNPTVFDREQWCSTLDMSTSSPCQANDGKVYKLGQGPRPPAHWACRSTILGLLAGQPAPRREVYDTWLRRQTREVQDDVLGPTQAKLWRDGGVKLERFVDRSGEAYTLTELRSREAKTLASLGA